MNDQPHFDINAFVVRQLGEELVSDEVTALIELVKNAYDADASYANIVVDTRGALDDNRLYFVEKNGFHQVGRGYVTIEDDGNGMTRDEIERGWLTISWSGKREMKARGELTPRYKRTPLGQKGLGRLSTQRLGHRLEMFTCPRAMSDDLVGQKEPEYSEHQVAFDWADFTEDTKLTAVPVRVRSTRRKESRYGTKLVITGLREPDIWLGDSQRRLIGQLSQLIFPFAEVRPFNVYLTVNGSRIDLATIAEDLREVAVSRFRFSFDRNHEMTLRIRGRIRLARLKGGRGGDREDSYDRVILHDRGREFFAYLTSPHNKYQLPNVRYLGEGEWFLSYEESLGWRSLGGLALDNGKPANPGSFEGEIDEFFFRGVNLEPIADAFSKAADYKDAVKQHVGVRIYRDGFGIRPYGLDGSDWLKLGGGQTSGLSWYSPRPQNVIGYIALSARENDQLLEKTDREGFVDNPYSRNFFLILDTLVGKLGVLFNNLGRSYIEFERQCLVESSDFLMPGRFVPEAHGIAMAAGSVEQKLSGLELGLDEVTVSVQNVVDRVDAMPLLATEEERRLSALLGDAGVKLSEARALALELRLLLEKLRRIEDTALVLQARMDILQDQLEQFSELAGLGLTAEALSHEINMVADRLGDRTKSLRDSLDKRGGIDSQIVAYMEYVHSAISALRKQLSHLAPSLRYVRERKDEIRVRTFLLELEEFYRKGRFKGPGIRIVLEEPFDDFVVSINKGKLTQIIDNILLNSEYWLHEAVRRHEVAGPAITVRSRFPVIEILDNGLGVDRSIESSLFQPFVTMKPKGQGRGLGLFIVRELLDSSGCSITLLPERNEFGRRYIFQIDLSGVANER